MIPSQLVKFDSYMVRFNVSQAKESALLLRMEQLGIYEGDLVEKFVKGSGAGGQKINKTSSCVYLLHRPSGIEIKCQATRSQTMNRFLARRELCDKIESKIKGAQSAQAREIHKIKKQKKRRSRRSRQQTAEGKRHRGEIKRGRGPVRGE